jgi:predicted nuclease of restriction endonuclease-like RecB superfamily
MIFRAAGARMRPTMLTSDLLRVRFSGNEVIPRYITRREADQYLSICRSVLKIFNNSAGRSRSDILEQIQPLEREGDFKIIRGLVKLVEDQCMFAPPVALNFPEYRARIFQSAQQYYPIVTNTNLLHTKRRDEVIKEIAASLRIMSQELEEHLLGDLPENQVLLALNTLSEPETLLQRYNLALAQALLYFATDVTIEIESDFKIVWKYIKLARLIHEMEKTRNGYRVRLTGPMSVFRNTRRYGIRMAVLLPGLLLAERFSMKASVMIGENRKSFRLDQNCGLRSHYRETPKEFDSKVESELFEKFTTNKKTSWTIMREGVIIDLGDTVFIPDFTFSHPDGRKAMLEIMGFWTPEYIEKKLQKIRRVKGSRLIVAISRDLNCSRKDTASLTDKRIIHYKGVLKVKDVVRALDGV